MSAIRKTSRKTARDVMTPEPICVDPSMTIAELARIFNENEISGVPVVDAQGRAIGMVSKTDLIRRCSEGVDRSVPGFAFEALNERGVHRADLEAIRVEDFMTSEPMTVTPGTPLGTVASLMHQLRIHRVIVADEDLIPVGIITSLDLLKTYPED